MVLSSPSIASLLPPDLASDVAEIARLTGREETDVVIEMLRGAVTLWRRHAPSAQLLPHDGAPSRVQLQAAILRLLRRLDAPVRRRDLQQRLEQELGTVVAWWRIRNVLTQLVKGDLVRTRPRWRYEAVACDLVDG